MKKLIAAVVVTAFSVGAFAQPAAKTDPAASGAATGMKHDSKKAAAKPHAKKDMKAKKGASAPA
ncbi:hypothetical protein [Piscinibacter koreensis]|uniref:Pentapeptide MXKDX repeat protein n=1 Tax=Piscinibacter koreensis TaxID=2742824 RepID=A0A7Y6NLD9_9BURK|nr:hypothetical protein [Schlegelella koreensis]NUZ05341.1 hypothetical protein [Schlegelella koreensis]